MTKLATRFSKQVPPIRTIFIVFGAIIVFGMPAQPKDPSAIAEEAGKKAAAVEEVRRKADATAAEERKKEDDCKTDLRCWAEKHYVSALIACQPRIERLAQYQFEWTTSWLDPKFPRYAWNERKKGLIVYAGDRIKFQNGFGAWQYFTYKCVYDPAADAVLDVEAFPGRLPQ